MRIIEVLNMIANGEIKEGTLLKIVDEKYDAKQSTFEFSGGYFYHEEDFSLEGLYSFDFDFLNKEVELIEPKPKKYYLRLDEDDDLSYVTRSSYDSDFNYDLGDENEIMEFKTKFTQEEIDNDKLLKFIEQHGVKEEVEDNEID